MTTFCDPLEAKLVDLVIPESGLEFDGDTFRNLSRPQVYIMLKSNMPLYIGMTGCGISRPAGKVHRQAEQARQECTRVLIYTCRTEDDARVLERMLLHKVKTKYNFRLVGAKARAAGPRLRPPAPPRPRYVFD